MLNPLRSEQEAFRFLALRGRRGGGDRGRRAGRPGALNARPRAGRARRPRGRRAAAGARRRARAGPRAQVLAHRPGLRRRPRRRAADRRAAPRPSGPTTACWARRAPRARVAAAGAGWSTRSTAPPTSSTASRRGRCRSRSRTARAPRSAWCTTRGRGETFTRRPRRAAPQLNGEPIAVGGCDRLERALVATGFGYERRAPRRARPRCWRACSRACATSAARARRRSTSPGWPRPPRRLLRARPQALGLGGGAAAGDRGGRRRAGAARRAPRARGRGLPGAAGGPGRATRRLARPSCRLPRGPAPSSRRCTCRLQVGRQAGGTAAAHHGALLVHAAALHGDVVLDRRGVVHHELDRAGRRLGVDGGEGQGAALGRRRSGGCRSRPRRASSRPWACPPGPARRCPRPAGRPPAPRRRPRPAASCPVTRSAGILLLRSTFEIWRRTTPSTVSSPRPSPRDGPKAASRFGPTTPVVLRPAEDVAASRTSRRRGSCR